MWLSAATTNVNISTGTIFRFVKERSSYRNTITRIKCRNNTRSFVVTLKGSSSHIMMAKVSKTDQKQEQKRSTDITHFKSLIKITVYCYNSKWIKSSIIRILYRLLIQYHDSRLNRRVFWRISVASWIMPPDSWWQRRSKSWIMWSGMHSSDR